MLITLISGIYLPTFVENGLTLSLPFDHNTEELRDRRSLAGLSESVEPVNEHIYLFALDCSSSIAKHLPEVPEWYRGAVKQLQETSYPVGTVEKPTAYDVAKAGFYFLLSDLVHAAGTRSDEEAGTPEQADQFAVWDVCGGGSKFYPESERMAPAIYSNAVKAIADLEGRDLEEAAKTTKFLELFRQVDRTYSIAEQSYGGSNKNRMFIITIISDFLDDPGEGATTQNDGLHPRDESWLIEKRKREIERAAQELLSGRIVVNVISISRDSGEDASIVSFMRDKTDWHRFNEMRIVDNIIDNADRLLYPVYRVKQPLRIYYERRSHVEASLTLMAEERGTIGLSLAARDQDPAEKFALEYGYWGGTEVDGHEVNGRLAAGQSERLENLPGNTSIALSYRGALPAHDQTLKIAVASERRTYLVPVRFLPRLPIEVARALLFLASAVGLFLLASMIGYPWGFCSGLISPARYLKK